MYQKIVEFINGLEEKELKEMYEKYCEVAFNFYVDSDKERCERAMNIVNLIDNTLREKGIWNKK